jgi:hypothetical protein
VLTQEQVKRQAGDLTFSVLWDSMSATFSLTNNGMNTTKITATTPQIIAPKMVFALTT